MDIIKNSDVPLYYQLADILREKITHQSIKPGESLPSENTLIKQYKLSRGTVRQAFQILTHEGLIERYPGRGSFVCQPKITHDATRVMGFYSQAMIEAGKVPSAKVLELREMPCQHFVRSKLKLNEKEPIVFIKRLRFADGEPIAVETSYFKKEIGRKLMEQDLSRSIYGLLQENLNYIIYMSQNTIEASLADAETADLMEIAENSPLLLIRRLVYLSDRQPFEYSLNMCRADKIRFLVYDYYQKDKTGFSVKAGMSIESKDD